MQLRWRMDAVDETERGKQRAASDGVPWPWRAKERGEEGRSDANDGIEAVSGA